MKKENSLAWFNISSSDISNVSYFRIGHIILDVPPSNIEVNKQHDFNSIGGLRSGGDTLISSGYSKYQIIVKAYFYGPQQIEDRLLPIVGLYKVCPIVDIENKFIRDQLFGGPSANTILGGLPTAYGYDMPMSMVLDKVTLTLMPNLRGLNFEAVFVFNYYNHLAISPTFDIALTPDGGYGTIARRVKRWIDKTKNISEVSAAEALGLREFELNENEMVLYGYLYKYVTIDYNSGASGQNPPANTPQVTQPSGQPANTKPGTPKEPDPVDPSWVKVAEGQAGQSEYAGDAANPRILRYWEAVHQKQTSDEVPWCSAFMNWVMQQSGRKGTGSAAANSWANWGKPLSKPVYGCVVLLSPPHVGLYVGEVPGNPSSIKVLGGNQGNGGTVKVSHFKKSQVVCYRWPSNEKVEAQPEVTMPSTSTAVTVTPAEMTEETKQELERMKAEGWVVDQDKSNFYCIVFKKPYGIPFFSDNKGDFIYTGAGPNSPWYNSRSRILIQSISIGYANKVVPIPLMGFNLPFWQHLGAGNLMVSINAIAIADEQTGKCPVLEEVQALFNVKEEQVLRNKSFALYDPKYTNEIQTVGVYSEPLNMVGFNRAILSNLSVSTIDNTPNAFNVGLSFIENYMYDAALHDRSSALTVLENRILPDLIQQALVGSNSTDVVNDEVKEVQRNVKAKADSLTDFSHTISDSALSQEEGMVLNMMRGLKNMKDGVSYLRPLVRITASTADSALNTASSFTTPGGFAEAIGLTFTGPIMLPMSVGKDIISGGTGPDNIKFMIARYTNFFNSGILPGVGSGLVSTYDEVVGNNTTRINNQVAMARAMKELTIKNNFMSEMSQQYTTVSSKYIEDYKQYAEASDSTIWMPGPGGVVNPVVGVISEVATTYLGGLIDGIASLFGETPKEKYLELWDRYHNSEPLFLKIKNDIKSGNVKHELWDSFVKDNLYVSCYSDLLLENNENPADYLQPPGETSKAELTDMYSLTTTAAQAVNDQIVKHYMSLPQYKVMQAAKKAGTGTALMESKPMDKKGLFKEIDGKADYNKAMDYVDSLIKTDSEGLKKMMKDKYDYNRSFPTYKVFLVEDGAAEEKEGIVRHWDQFFDYSAITEIEVARFKHDVDVAVVRMLNTFGQLTTRVLESGLIVEPTQYKDITTDIVFDKSGRVQRDEEGNLIKVDLEGNMTPLSRIFLQAGTKIVIKMGYSNDEEQLPVVFTGLVSDIQPGDVVTIICQGFMSELLVPLENYLGDYVGGAKGKLQTLTGTEPGSDFLTSVGIPVGSLVGGTLLAPATMGLSLAPAAAIVPTTILRRISKAITINQSHTYWLAYTVLSHPAAIHFGSWDFVGYKNKNGNNYMLGSEWQLLTGQRTRCVDNVDLKLRDSWQAKSSIIEMFPFLDSFSVNDPQQSTLWEVLREAVYRHPSHIITVRPYGPDATLVIKQPTDSYKVSNIKFVKPTVNDDFESKVFRDWVNKNYWDIKTKILKYTDPRTGQVHVDRRRFREMYNWNPDQWDQWFGSSYGEAPETCSGEMAMYYIQRAGDPSMAQCFMPYSEYQNLVNNYMTYKKSLQEADPTLKGKLNTGETTRPVRKYFYASDRRNMLFNNIRTNENIYNAVRVKIEEDEEDALIQAVDDDLPDRYVRPFSYISKNLKDNAASGGRANDLKGLYAFSILIEKLNEMYRGELAIIGEPDIMPFDAIVLDDRINQLYGTFEVASVTHRFTQSEGFITFIEPHFQSRVADAALAAATGATEDLVRINNVNQYYYIMEAENRKRDLYGQYAYGIIGNVDQDVNMDQLLTSGGELAYNVGMLFKAAETIAPFIFGGNVSETFFKLSNKAYNAGPFRQPIIIEPLTFRTVPFVAGIRGYLYNGWFDSLSIKLAAVGRELAQDLKAMGMGIRHLFKEADYVIESKHRRIIKTP